MLHNLLEQSEEEFDEDLLEVEDVFPRAALESKKADEAGVAMDLDEPADDVVVVGARESPAARRLRVAKEIWNRKYPRHRID